jgi:alpha-1,2-mannosyltransferase
VVRVPEDRQRGVVVASILVGLALAVSAMNLLLVSALATRPLWDLEVYRQAIRFWAAGGELYDFRLDHPAREGGFPFTYPPFAALVMRPLTLLPDALVDNAWTIGSLVLVTAIAAFVIWRAPRTDDTWLGRTPTLARLISFTAASVVALQLTLPFVHTLVLGQISLAITAMALFDAGGLVPRRFQGILIGLAAALKLTPLIFIPYFLVTRQWRQAAVASGVFAGATAVAFVLAPQQSVTYWGDKLLETSRVGELATVQNKSIAGWLARWELGGAAQTAIWIALALVVLTLALWQARRQYRAGSLVGAALIVGCASVAVSPVSWPHHQTWIVLVGIWLLLYRRPLYMILGVALIAIMAVGSPLMGQEVIPLGTNDPWILRVGRELPTFAFMAVCALGLPIDRSRRASGADAEESLARR